MGYKRTAKIWEFHSKWSGHRHDWVKRARETWKNFNSIREYVFSVFFFHGYRLPRRKKKSYIAVWMSYTVYKKHQWLVKRTYTQQQNNVWVAVVGSYFSKGSWRAGKRRGMIASRQRVGGKGWSDEYGWEWVDCMVFYVKKSVYGWMHDETNEWASDDTKTAIAGWWIAMVDCWDGFGWLERLLTK